MCRLETCRDPVHCPYCGSYWTARERGLGDWVWLIAAAASLFLRWLLTLARHGGYRGEPGMYRCASRGRSFIFFL
jgi:hypothetical protein